MGIRRLCGVVAALLCLLVPSVAQAAPVLELGDNTTYLHLAPYVDAFVEDGSSMDIGGARGQQYSPPSNLFSDANVTYWLRFRYHAVPTQRFYVFLGYKPTYVDLYVEQPDGGVFHQRSGASVPFSQRPTPDFGVIDFALPPAPTVTTAYLRIRSNEPSTALSVEAEPFLLRANASINAIAGALCAILFMLFLMSLVLMAMFRRPVYAYYSIYLFAQLLYRLNDSGIAGAWLWPNLSFSWAQGDVFFDGITLVAATLFLRSFLDLREYSRTLDWLNIAVAAIGALYAIAALFGVPIRVTLVWNFAFLYVPLWVITIAYCWRRGHVQAKLLLVAWSAFMIGQILLDVKNLGFAPNNFFALFFFSYGPYAGLTLECMLITMILSLDVKRMQGDFFEKLAARDGLTGLINRARFETELNRAIASCRASGQPLALLLIDLDEFSAVNAVRGPLGGDDALRTIAHALSAVIERETDILARFEGDRFAAILPYTHVDEAFKIAERLRAAVESTNTVTARVGVTTTFLTKDSSAEEVIDSANRAAAAAKSRGGNCVQIDNPASAIVHLNLGFDNPTG